MTSIADDVLERAVAVRREIHRHPELGFEEERTAAIVERELDALGIAHRRLAATGVAAVIEGSRAGRVAALRADMDALPLTERSGEPFASEVAGKMHACGHDAHTAMLLAAAGILQRSRASLEGSVVCIFQPAEEGPGGALPMIEAGVLEAPPVDAAAMLHVDVRLPAGAIGLTPGFVSAATDEFTITLEGVGGHGGRPQLSVDAIPCAGALVLALQNIVAREIDPLRSAVVTVGTIAGGYRSNIIADKVVLTGTFRSYDPEVRAGLVARTRRIAQGIAGAYGCTAHVELTPGYPAVYNDVPLTAGFEAYLRGSSGIDVQTLEPTMGGEDFAYIAQRVPALLVRLGIRNEAIGAVHPPHSPLFKIDEAALGTGIETLVSFARGAASGALQPQP